VPTVSCLLEGSEEDVFNASLECMRDGVDILSPSCGLPPSTSLRNLLAMVEAIRHCNETGPRLQ
jgi:[methyl-Co(III) methanol-specific corrinoid protein]:coenzyme M methyltransferase